MPNLNGRHAVFTQVDQYTVGFITYGRVIVSLYDINNNPLIGDNCIISYKQNTNGVITDGSVVLPGTSTTVYSGELSQTDGDEGFFVSFTLTGIQNGTTPPDQATCDLVINSITPVNETAIGAEDGQISISATTSHGPIQYSIDNVTWQDSNIFTGLPGGPGTAYVKDVLAGCARNLSYTVPVSTNILIQDPSIDLGNGHVSRWNAAFNPIYFIFQRIDFEISGIVAATDGSGLIKVNIINADVSAVAARTPTVVNFVSTYIPGDFVYLKTPAYEGSFEVMTGGTNSLVLNCPYAANDGEGFINIDALKPYYSIQMVITYVDPITGRLNTISPKSKPLPDGYCRVDISSFLQSILDAKSVNKSDYTLLNYRDAQLSASYQVKFAEVWTGNTPIWITQPLPYYVLFAAMQLQFNGGGNLVDYVPFLLGFQPAKWVTDFVNPVYSYGFPFDIGFIFSECMVGLAPFFNVTLLDINKNPIADQSVESEFLLNEDGSFILNEDGSKFIIANQSVVNYPIVEHVGLNRLLLNFNPPANCYWFNVDIKYTLSGTDYKLMQTIMCRVDDSTPDRPVYLRWIGLTGSWNYYRFVYNQVITLEVTNPVVIKNYVIDWQAADSIEDVVSNNAGEKMTVYGENITVNDIKGLQSIKYSPKVQLYTGTGPKWQTVIVQAGTFTERETMIDAYSVSFAFALPTKNIQNN